MCSPRHAPGSRGPLHQLLLGAASDVTIWTGTAGGAKSVAWSEPLSLPAVKAVAAANQCTVNDVLVATVAGCLHDYLQAHQARCSSVTFMVPVNLKPLDLTLPETLGNEFALVQLELPTDEPDAHEVLAVAKRRMDRIKTVTKRPSRSGSRRPSPGSAADSTKPRWTCSPIARSAP